MFDKNIIQLHGKLKNYKSKADQVRNILSNNKIPPISDTFSEQQRNEKISYVISKINYDITNLMQEGYRLIQLLREFFSGQEIVYDIGYERGRGNNKQLHRVTLTMNEALEGATWGRATIGKDGTLDLMLKMTNKTRIELQNRNKIHSFNKDSEEYKLLTKIRLYRDKQPEPKKFLNDGQLYEVYVNFAKDGRYNVHESSIASMCRQVKSNTDKFYEKGDIGLIQVKSLLGGKPTFANFSTIIMAIEALEKLFADCVTALQSNKNTKKYYTKIKKFFSIPQASKQIDVQIMEAALKALDELVITEINTT